ncbi:hypothetical protein HPP92_019593 [Vanilla planifolia]|uniref:DUF7722 domain-containing protein n=1 Tax=Vanilla planifolia TaxID=51239 RepID=A0A835UJG7_VANPL|nr:hypothetical protein HPP92_019593 [Vanilla planifolia]
MQAKKSVRQRNDSNAHDETKESSMARKDQESSFHMPLHYPRYTRLDYEAMAEWKLDCLFQEYGLPAVAGDVNCKREFAIGAFLWPIK